jgi:nitroreductase
LVSRPSNLLECRAAVVLALTNPKAAFDGGRTAQNIMVAAWSLGIGSCPNTPTDETALKKTLEMPEEMSVPTILSLGYPALGEPRPARKADPSRVLARINRLPLKDLLSREAFRD